MVDIGGYSLPDAVDGRIIYSDKWPLFPGLKSFTPDGAVLLLNSYKDYHYVTSPVTLGYWEYFAVLVDSGGT